MGKFFRGYFKLFAAVILSLFALSGCGQNSAGEEKITLAGSTSMEKVTEALSEGFRAKNPKATVTAEYIGTGAGVEALVKKKADIGNASRELKQAEKDKGATPNVIAYDAIAIIVDKNNQVRALKSEELSAIYGGKVKNWSELGGADKPIIVIGRENGSGTRDAFEETLKLKNKCAYAQELDSTGAVIARVASTEGAIGYVSLDALSDKVSLVSLNGTVPSEETVKDGSYSLSRPFIMATRGKLEEQSPAVRKWFSFVFSEDGKALIKKAGLVPVSGDNAK